VPKHWLLHRWYPRGPKKLIKSYLWNRTMLNLWGIVAAILKMATGRNFSMSGYHYLPTYQMTLKSVSAIFKMAAKIRYKKWAIKIQHCPISSKFDMCVDNDVQNWFLTLKNFYRSPFSKWPPQCRTNSTLSDFNAISYIIIYPHIKFWWYRTMLNFYPPFFMPCFGNHFENGRHLENFENAELLL
jgi:hypothetical protein